MKKNTKIVCTIGPASQDIRILSEMANHDMAIARLNFSHGTHANHAVLLKHVRAVSKKLKKKILVMQDLQGPKIRVQELRKPIKIVKGKTVVIGKDFSIDMAVAKDIRVGNRVLIQDGLIALRVTKIVQNYIYCTVLNSGLVQSHKGVNLPDTKLSLPSLTEKDIVDLAWGLQHGVDAVAVSFVRSVDDIVFTKKKIRELLPKGVKHPKLVAKIEKPEAIKNLSSIVKAVDVVMVARGDLGVEMPEEKVPGLQRKIIRACHLAKKPVIVATQMLESMVNNPRPTRAEVEDVADAVREGANYVMLSEESAFGKYPAEAVAEMSKIIREVRKN